MHDQHANHLVLSGENSQALRMELTGSVAHDKRSADPFEQVGGTAIYSRNVLLDLSKCHYINSGGVAWLLVHHRRFHEGGGKLILHSASPVVMQIFNLMKMELVLNLCQDLDEAERLLQQAAHN
jgi:anti-anti-sigma factor